MAASIERSGRDRFATDTRLIAADVALPPRAVT
ncbi:hypothetical protein ACVIWU_007993 [Bradyrhizobium sp. USDA 4509]|nr:hypothetical protein [Bradyrhizobium sp. USDA 4541]